MKLTPIFSVGIGKADESQLLEEARALFKDNQQLFGRSEEGLFTTLQKYNSNQNCAILNNQGAVSKIKEAIKNNARLFYAGIGFNVEQLDFEVDNLWLNEMTANSYHKPHSHYGYQISGCFYVDVPQGSNLIKFYSNNKKIEHGDNPEKEHNQYNAQFFASGINEGDMFFWESLLTHEVPALEFEGVRRSIAYDLSVSRKIPNLQIVEKKYKMNLQDYVAIYNINDLELCKKVIQTQDESAWTKHSYNNPIINKNTSYKDDLDVSYQDDEVTNSLQQFFEQCVKEYINTVSPFPFLCQTLTRIRFNRYKVGTNMKVHADHIHTIFDGERKGVPIISILALLNDDFEGGDFVMFDGKKVKLSAGDVIVFPSNFLYPHAVTTVTKGTRYSCVSWAY
jgi:uncharacterized protein (TIGR02466 family)